LAAEAVAASLGLRRSLLPPLSETTGLPVLLRRRPRRIV
jgi:hypothetical protein